MASVGKVVGYLVYYASEEFSGHVKQVLFVQFSVACPTPWIQLYAEVRQSIGIAPWKVCVCD